MSYPKRGRGWRRPLISLASRSYQTGDTAEDWESRQAAAAVHLEAANPLQAALSDCLERHPGGSVLVDEVRERLTAYPGVASPVPNRTLGDGMLATFSVSSTSTTRQGKTVKHYAGVRLRVS